MAPSIIFSLLKYLFIFTKGFDAYFKALRPKTAKVCGSVGGSNNHNGIAGSSGHYSPLANNNGSSATNGENQYYRNAVKGSRIYNCRNPWFKLFWEQHFKCRFNSTTTTTTTSSLHLPECKGGDKLTYYEQEGLVPFVGEFWIAFPFLNEMKKFD